MKSLYFEVIEYYLCLLYPYYYFIFFTTGLIDAYLDILQLQSNIHLQLSIW